jgi:hypothetical protein
MPTYDEIYEMVELLGGVVLVVDPEKGMDTRYFAGSICIGESFPPKQEQIATITNNIIEIIKKSSYNKYRLDYMDCSVALDVINGYNIETCDLGLKDITKEIK